MLLGIAADYREALVCLHRLLCAYPLLHRHGDFLFAPPRIAIGCIAGIGRMKPVLLLSLGFTNPKTDVCLQFVVEFELGAGAARVGQPRGFDVNLTKNGNPTVAGNISLKEYVKHRRLAADTGIGEFDAGALLDDNLQRFLSDAASILEGPMNGILTGVEWDPVPVDWDGYK